MILRSEVSGLLVMFPPYGLIQRYLQRPGADMILALLGVVDIISRVPGLC
jgi:hypothetical protein